MKIPDHLTEILHAIETVVAEIHRGQGILAETRIELADMMTATDDGCHCAEFLAVNTDLDYEGLNCNPLEHLLRRRQGST